MHGSPPRAGQVPGSPPRAGFLLRVASLAVRAPRAPPSCWRGDMPGSRMWAEGLNATVLGSWHDEAHAFDAAAGPDWQGLRGDCLLWQTLGRHESPRAGLRPARPPRGSRKLGAARRFLERIMPARAMARSAGSRPRPCCAAMPQASRWVSGKWCATSPSASALEPRRRQPGAAFEFRGGGRGLRPDRRAHRVGARAPLPIIDACARVRGRQQGGVPGAGEPRRRCRDARSLQRRPAQAGARPPPAPAHGPSSRNSPCPAT